jgi:S-adenosylmethionine/arginine decarboxylase-like enzyme
MRREAYGKELILDLHGCDPRTFTREHVAEFMETLCDAIGMERHDLHLWDDVGVPPELRQTDPKTQGTSAVQFITTSNVTIHCLDQLGKVFVNVFSCKEFSSGAAEAIAVLYFGGRVANRVEVTRL